MSVPLQFDERGSVVASGRVSIDGAEMSGTLLSVSFLSDETLHIQSMMYADRPRLNRSEPTLEFPSLSRTFLFRALQSDVTFEMEFSGTYCGEVTLVTHRERSTRRSPSPGTPRRRTTTSTAVAAVVAGALAPPVTISDEFYREHPASFRWPTEFALRGQIHWDALPFLFGDAYYFARLLGVLRRRQAELAQQT